MIKLLKFWLLNRVIKNPTLSAEIYQMMYQNRVFVRPATPYVEQTSTPVSSVPVSSPSSNRRRELLAALTELKSKPLKTKQDKESIGIMEAALKNVN
jgi:hypothetical protein